MKKYLFFLTSAMLAIGLAACSGGSQEEAASQPQEENESTSDSEEEVTLRMSWWGSQGRHDMTLQIIELYEEQNPHVKIEPEFTGFDGYFERMAAQAAGNNLPDIMQQNFGEYLNVYAEQGLLADLTEFVDSGIINLDGVSDTVLQSGEKDGLLLGIPTGTNALTALYAPDMLAEAGIEDIDENWTWDDYKAIVETVHAKTGKYGSRLMEPRNMFEYYLREQGYQFFNEDGTALGFDEQLQVDYLTMVKDLVESGVLPGYDVTQQVQGPEDELIVHGNTAIDWRWSNQVGVVTNAAGKELEMTMLPGANNDQGMYLKPAMLWSIGENSDKKEEAAKFIDFFTNTLEVYEIGGTDRGVPIKEEIREAMSPNLNEIDQKVFDYIDLVTNNSSPIASNFPSRAAEVLTALETIDEMVMYGRLTPEEGAAQFRDEAESILSR